MTAAIRGALSGLALAIAGAGLLAGRSADPVVIIALAFAIVVAP
jgi:hypothetical protein